MPRLVYLRNAILRRLLIWRGFGGRNWHFVIFIDGTLPDDLKTALIGHELYHTWQMEREGVWRYAWNYFTDTEFRIKMEREAYFHGPSYWRDKFGTVGMLDYIYELYG